MSATPVSVSVGLPLKIPVGVAQARSKLDRAEDFLASHGSAEGAELHVEYEGLLCRRREVSWVARRLKGGVMLAEGMEQEARGSEGKR